MVSLNGVKTAVNKNVTFFPPNLRKSSLYMKVDFSHTTCSICQHVICLKQGHAGLKKNCHYFTHCVGDLELDIHSLWLISKCVKSLIAMGFDSVFDIYLKYT
jgi:hypothetical protein